MMAALSQTLDREAGSQVLDELVDQVTGKLQAGEPFDLEEYVRRYPELEDQLRKLLPGIQMLAELGHAPAEAPASAGPDARLSPPPGHGTLGDYRIVREIGRGGMGVVYEAEQVSLGRKVALKVLPFAAMMDRRQLQRFQNEARAAASLKHPNIVQVYAVGCERAVHFYAMELVRGETLLQWSAKRSGKPVTPQELRTRLGVPGFEMNGPGEAAAALLQLIMKDSPG